MGSLWRGGVSQLGFLQAFAFLRFPAPPISLSLRAKEAQGEAQPSEPEKRGAKKRRKLTYPNSSPRDY